MAASLVVKGTVRRYIANNKRMLAAVERGQRRALFRAGGLVRTVARRSIRSGGKKNAVSKPNDPPRWHVKPGIREIYFGYDARTGTMPVGPIKFNAKGSDVPEKLEHGGVITISRKRHRNGQLVIERKKVILKPRPTMQPALAKTKDKIAQEFKDVIR